MSDQKAPFWRTKAAGYIGHPTFARNIYYLIDETRKTSLTRLEAHWILRRTELDHARRPDHIRILYRRVDCDVAGGRRSVGRQIKRYVHCFDAHVTLGRYVGFDRYV